MRLIVKSAAMLLFLFTLLLSTSVAESPRAKPADVGLSPERLQRIHELMERHIDAGNFSGAVTLVARNGRIAHLEAQGVMDIETKKPMTDKGLVKQNNPNFMNGVFFSGGGGLFTTAEDYFHFGLMLLNGGQLDGKRLLSPRTVELMRSVFIPDTLPGRARGEGFGLSVRVISDPVQRGTALSAGSFGWSGAFGTHFWVDPKEKVVAVLMVQTANNEARGDFETAVMQAIVE